ncbi:hypothetical protein LUZ60_003546 [Juncus effusus]|nr:hypothetical protein LUZ60_003546 [Juncus effusus]
MALIPSSPPSSRAQFMENRVDLNSIHSLISSVNHHITHFLSDPITRNSLVLKLQSFLSNSSPNSLSSSPQSVLSNLYSGIESTESAINSDSPHKKTQLLTNSEKLLQIPALQQEYGTSSGISNQYIVSLSYFYLCLVKKLQEDQWQMTIHFLQSVSVNPELVRTELVPKLYQCVFGTGRKESDDVAKRQARRYKSWLMYYQVVSYGETPPWSKNCEVGPCNTKCTSWLNNLNEKEGLKNNIDKFEGSNGIIKENFDIKRLQEMLEDSQSDSSETSNSEVKGNSAKILPIDGDFLASKLSDKKFISCTQDDAMIFAPESPQISNSNSNSNSNYSRQDSYSNYSSNSNSNSNSYSNSKLDNSILDFRDLNCISPPQKLRCFSNFSSKKFINRIKSFSASSRDLTEISSNSNYAQTELFEKFEKAILNLDAQNSEIITIWEFINNQKELKYNYFKHDIFEQLLYGISSSQKDIKIMRASVNILIRMISQDKTILQDLIKNKLINLDDLSNAVKKNIHEAVILIYLLNPSPMEIKTLDLLSNLIEIASNNNNISNNYKKAPEKFPITPKSASINLIEIMVTSFDYVTNNVHLAALSSPQNLGKLVNLTIWDMSKSNLEECVGLSAILVRCMKLNGNCKKFLSQVTPVGPFIEMLTRREKIARSAALEYFHEILQIPRSSANNLLREIKEKGGVKIMQTLMTCMHKSKLDHRLLAANLLLQLDLLAKPSTKSVYRDEAMAILLEALSSEENCGIQALAANILANMGGTHSWGGESYLAALLLKKAGLVSTGHRNMVRNVDWIDPCLQEPEASEWSSRTSHALLKSSTALFTALSTGLKSKTKSVARDCLICAAWLGTGFGTGTVGTGVREKGCEVLLDDVAEFLHPCREMDERVLGCLCVYNYTSGKGKQKLMSFSEGIRESLRRLSGVTWMAEELLRVTDYFLPTKSRVSCVHTQILEIGQGNNNGATTAITFFKGQLYAGYSDGTIKAWEIRGERAMLVREIRKHKRAVTCFAIFEPGDNLLSGSSDKSIRVWSVVQRKIECIEVLQMKEPVQKLETFGEKIFVITQNRCLKVSYGSRSTEIICKNKRVKSISVSQGKMYLGCTDSSIQELDMVVNNCIEIRAPDKTWKLRKSPINSIVIYKDSMYCAGSTVNGSNFKDWRKNRKAPIALPLSKGSKVQEMAIVEDFIYLNCAKNSSIMQIWLREKKQKVGRLVAGSKITCLLAANDTFFCGTETGLIKAWIPL